MIDKFIKINTATSGPVLINALEISSVINKGAVTQLNIGSYRKYTVSNAPLVSGDHTALEVTSGTTTSDGTSGWPPQLIDSNATFTSSGVLPGDWVFDNPVTQMIDQTNAYEQYSNVVINDTTLHTNQSGLVSGVDYKIYSGSKIFDPNTDFAAAGVQPGMAVIVGRGQTGASPIDRVFVNEVSGNSFSLIGLNQQPAANYGANGEILAARALGLFGGNTPVTYKVFSAGVSTVQTAINAAIADVLNNTTSHVVEIPFVVDEVKTSLL